MSQKCIEDRVSFERLATASDRRYYIFYLLSHLLRLYTSPVSLADRRYVIQYNNPPSPA